MNPPPERGLGRGLSALIPLGPTRGPEAGAREVPLDRVKPNPGQPRTSIEPAALGELAESIRAHGVIQPIIVSELPEGAYQLIAGERRWRAARLAGLATVPVVVKEASPRSSLEMALVENIQRQDLNALEEASAYKQLLEEHGLTQEALANRLGKSRVAVTNTLRLLQLPPLVQQALAEGAITEGHARAILGTDSDEGRLALLERVRTDGLNVRQTEALARRLGESATDPGEAPGRPNQPLDPDVARFEEAFRQALGTRVQLIRRGTHGGRLVIHFYSDDELQGLYDTIVRE